MFHVYHAARATCDGLCLGAGVLVLVINYTGDRIHFGLATERAREEGLKVGLALVAFSAWRHAIVIFDVFVVFVHGMVFVRCHVTFFMLARLFYSTPFLISE